jgi:hypothetical protein
VKRKWQWYKRKTINVFRVPFWSETDEKSMAGTGTLCSLGKSSFIDEH